MTEEKPSGAHTTTRQSQGRADQLLTIGQVVGQLSEEFPDLSITKVRYLEDRGLLAPSRTPGRYRKYSGADVRRLRTILTLQRDEYLPLDVIRQRVDRAVMPATGKPVGSCSTPMRTTPILKREEADLHLGGGSRRCWGGCRVLQVVVEFRLIDGYHACGPRSPRAIWKSHGYVTSWRDSG